MTPSDEIRQFVTAAFVNSGCTVKNVEVGESIVQVALRAPTWDRWERIIQALLAHAAVQQFQRWECLPFAQFMLDAERSVVYEWSVLLTFDRTTLDLVTRALDPLLGPAPGARKSLDNLEVAVGNPGRWRGLVNEKGKGAKLYKAAGE